MDPTVTEILMDNNEWAVGLVGIEVADSSSAGTARCHASFFPQSAKVHHAWSAASWPPHPTAPHSCVEWHLFQCSQMAAVSSEIPVTACALHILA